DKMIWVLDTLKVNEEIMKRNLENVKYFIMDERIILKLVEKGLGRQEAHELVRKYAIKSQTENKDFKKLFLEDEKVKNLIDENELEEIVDPKKYLGEYDKIIERIIKISFKEEK
ncbi:MAG: adenylosuccinate lyase, partial [Thermoplasmata archaeon]